MHSRNWTQRETEHYPKSFRIHTGRIWDALGCKEITSTIYVNLKSTPYTIGLQYGKLKSRRVSE